MKMFASTKTMNVGYTPKSVITFHLLVHHQIEISIDRLILND